MCHVSQQKDHERNYKAGRTKMKKEDIDKIARWHNTLNSWEWPDDLPGKPEGWDSLSRFRSQKEREDGIIVITKYHLSAGLMDWFKQLIGNKECLRWHHINNLRRTNEEFEKWFDEDRPRLHKGE